MSKRKPLPPTYFMSFIIISLISHFLIPIYSIISYPWNSSGVVLIILGIWLNLSADRKFKEVKTTVKPFESSTYLVTDGVFRISRNPMYLGMVAILLGGAVFLGTLTPFLIALIFAILIDIRFIKAEEKMLDDTFGEKWQSYKSKTGRWL
jgi:protein-S-isoprenylcysteine O-methyltransferase Ste14